MTSHILINNTKLNRAQLKTAFNKWDRESHRAPTNKHTSDVIKGYFFFLANIQELSLIYKTPRTQVIRILNAFSDYCYSLHINNEL